MSQIIAELIGNINDFENGHWTTYRSVLFPQPAIRSGEHQSKWWAGSQGSIRLPWIHNSNSVDFQLVNILLSNNHFIVPLWCPSQTILWFVEGSEGESQCRTSLWNWSPAMVVSVLADEDRKVGKQMFDFVHFVYDLLKWGYKPGMSGKHPILGEKHTQRLLDAICWCLAI